MCCATLHDACKTDTNVNLCDRCNVTEAYRMGNTDETTLINKSTVYDRAYQNVQHALRNQDGIWDTKIRSVLRSIKLDKRRLVRTCELSLKRKLVRLHYIIWLQSCLHRSTTKPWYNIYSEASLCRWLAMARPRNLVYEHGKHSLQRDFEMFYLLGCAPCSPV
jgi:hypothetical protein